MDQNITKNEGHITHISNKNIKQQHNTRRTSDISSLHGLENSVESSVIEQNSRRENSRPTFNSQVSIGTIDSGHESKGGTLRSRGFRVWVFSVRKGYDLRSNDR